MYTGAPADGKTSLSLYGGRGLVMACLNINGLLCHINNLRLFLESHKEIDILAINETKIDQSIHDREIFLSGYQVVRKDRARGGGGVCIYVRNNFNFFLRPDLSPETIECLTIEISKPNSKSFLVSTWYRPESPVSVFDTFENVIAKVDAEYKEIYLLGDTNCNFLPSANDPNAKHLRDILELYGLAQLITKPTRITASSRSLIDHCITNCVDKIKHSGVIHLGISDHSLVFMIRKSNSFRNGGHKTIKTREWKLFNEANFLADLEKKNWVCHGENPNAQWEGWKANLMDTIDKHAPIRNKRVRAKKSPWIDYDLVRKMRKRDLLKRQHAMTNDPDLWLEYKKSRNDVNNCIKIAKRKYYTENLEANVQDQRKTWKLLNELQNRQSVKGSISELKMGDATLKDPTSIAEAFNSHFTNVGPNLAQSISHTDIDPLSYLKPVSSSFSFHEVTNKDVLLLLQNLNSKKATGPDKIPAKLLKLAGNIISPSLTKIFNCSLSSGIFPEDWKVARVSPVYKAGTKSDPNNYRPISVVPIVAKIFEKLVHNQLYRYLATNNLLANNQSGFRSLHSTLTALIDANNSWCVNIDKGLINGVVFIDLKKAFDTIDHKILIQKLKVYGIDRNTLPWFESYLLNRQQHCSINGHISKDRNLSVGVPQGTLLGPLLFLIYINDLPNSIGLGHSRMYADDTSISFAAQTKHELQTLINRELSNVNIWLKSNKLSLNVAKTEFMTIGSRQRLMTQANAPIDIHIESSKIKQVSKTKSIGVIIDETLSWAEHVNYISKKISSAIGALKRVRCFIDQATAAKIYKAIIEPHFNYCSPVFDGISQKLDDKLQKLQNRAARIVTRSSFDESAKPLLDMLGWDTVSVAREKQKAITMFKSVNSLAPKYLMDMFSYRQSLYNFRNSENILNVPKPRTNYLKRSLGYSGAVLWNGLTCDMRTARSLADFKKQLNGFFL